MFDSGMDSDAALVSRLAAGEGLALDILMKRYQEPLYYFVLRYVHDEAYAYDLVQETFLKVYTRAESYKAQYRFTTWLYQIALNLCRDYGRRKVIRTFFSLSASEEKGKIPSPLVDGAGVEDSFDADGDIRRLHREISQLPHRLKAALILYALEENSQAVCSEILGISKKAVETRVYRARKLLEEKMSKNVEG